MKSVVGLRARIAASLAMSPAWFILIFAYTVTIGWTFWISLTDSKVFPSSNFVGLAQYERLFRSSRWHAAIENVAVFGVLFIVGCLILGFLLAVFLDSRVRAEGVFRTIFLYPYAMSFIVTGLVWQWSLNPSLGIEATIQNFGFENFKFDWIVRSDRAIFVVVLAAIWQSSGLVMVILLAGLRGVDEDLWKAARIDGIPAWKVYLRIVIPIIAPAIGTSVVLLSIAVVKAYDLVVALTGGGPGNATEVPAKFVMDYLFGRQNVGLATAASTVMFLVVAVVMAAILLIMRRQGRTS